MFHPGEMIVQDWKVKEVFVRFGSRFAAAKHHVSTLFGRYCPQVGMQLGAI